MLFLTCSRFIFRKLMDWRHFFKESAGEGGTDCLVLENATSYPQGSRRKRSERSRRAIQTHHRMPAADWSIGPQAEWRDVTSRPVTVTCASISVGGATKCRWVNKSFIIRFRYFISVTDSKTLTIDMIIKLATLACTIHLTYGISPFRSLSSFRATLYQRP